MAIPLNTTPTNPIARLLDPSAAARAVAQVAPSVATSTNPMPSHFPSTRAVRASTPPALVKREVVLTPRTDETLSRLTELVRRSTGARVSASHGVRCLLLTLGAAWPRIEDELRALGPLRLPGNARGTEPEREALERTLAGAIARALRASVGEP